MEKGAFGVAGDSYESKEDDYIFRLKQREIRARYLSLEEELGANQAEQDAVMAEWDRTQSTLKILEERVAAYRALMNKQNGAKIQYLELLQQQTDMAKSLPIFTSHHRQLSSSAEALKAQREAMFSEIRNQNLLALAQLLGEKTSLEQEYRKAARRHGLQLVRAPVSGAVQELAVHTVGGVVQSAQPLMKIVPDGAIIEVEALLRNQDIGFVQEGQPSVVKIDAYNFTKYGLLDAFVANISNDAIEDQQLGWAFKIRLQLKSEQLAVGNKWVKVVPGMSVVAEIKTGKRRLIEFFLSPLLRYKQESIRER
jgi:hemolysin D